MTKEDVIEAVKKSNLTSIEAIDLLKDYFISKGYNIFKASEYAENSLPALENLVFEEIKFASEKKVESLFSDLSSKKTILINKGFFEVQKIIDSIRITFDPDKFEILCSKILEKAFNFTNVKVTQRSRDGGYDSHGNIQLKDFSGSTYFNLEVYCQSKFYKSNITRAELDKFLGLIIRNEKEKPRLGLYIFMTTSDFSKESLRWAKELGVLSLDGNQIATIVYRNSKVSTDIDEILKQFME